MAAIDGLKRVAKVYGLLERMRSAELGLAAAQVHEVEQVGAQARSLRQECGVAGRAALLGGDRQQWLLAEAERQAGEVFGRRLEGLRLEREGFRLNALLAHRVSHLQSSQVKQAIETREQGEAMEQQRRMQAAADDRYLSRRAWMKDQDERNGRMITG